MDFVDIDAGSSDDMVVPKSPLEALQEKFDALQVKILNATGSEKERFEHDARMIDMELSRLKQGM